MTEEHSTKRNPRRIPIEHEDAMVAAYQAGATLKKSAEPFGYSLTTCCQALKRRGIPRRLLSVTRRLYDLDGSFFERIDSPLKAYVLGFVSADGCVDCESVRINLAREDRGQLEKIRDALGSNAPIKDYVASCRSGNNYPSSKLQIFSTKLANDLVRLGVVPAKSRILEPWQGPDELMRSYWLGLVDGDGSWRFRKKMPCGQRSTMMCLCGTRTITEAFADFVFKTTGVRSYAEPHSTIYLVKYSRILSMKKIANVLYHDAPMSLDRKRLVVEEMFAWQHPAHDWSDTTADDLLAMRAEEPSWAAVARRLGISSDSLLNLRHRRGIA